MIVKGKAQGGASKLAKHLCRTDHNERVRILGMDGLKAVTIPEALRDLDELGAAAETKRTLYHGIIAPRNHEPLNDEQRRTAVREMAKELGLEGQAHVVVGHLKKEEAEHFHIVWSRIDQERQAGISDSHNYRKHEELARKLEAEFGMAHTRGVHSRDRSREPRPGRTPEHWEMQQQARTGQVLTDARQIVTEAWKRTRTGQEFADALSQEGFVLARGDRRDFVLVDEAGGVHSLARRIEGAKAKDVRERMGDVLLEELEDVQQAKLRQRRLREAVELENSNRQVLSTAARLRLEEIERQGEARGKHPPLNQPDREISAALRMLQRLGTETHVVGGPPDARPTKRETVMEKLDREAREKGAAPLQLKIEPEPRRGLLRELVRPKEPRPDEYGR